MGSHLEPAGSGEPQFGLLCPPPPEHFNLNTFTFQFNFHCYTFHCYFHCLSSLSLSLFSVLSLLTFNFSLSLFSDRLHLRNSSWPLSLPTFTFLFYFSLSLSTFTFHFQLPLSLLPFTFHFYFSLFFVLLNLRKLFSFSICKCYSPRRYTGRYLGLSPPWV